MYPIENKLKSCLKCDGKFMFNSEPFHPSCINDYCIECCDDDIVSSDHKSDDDEAASFVSSASDDEEVTLETSVSDEGSYNATHEIDIGCLLCDGECTCRKSKMRSKGKKPRTIIVEDDDASESDTPQVEYQVADMWVETGTDDDASLSELDFSTSSDESVYEEPDTENGQNSDEDIMVEIVREKILNGWTSNEEESSEDEYSHDEIFLTAHVDEYPIKDEIVETPIKSIAFEPESDDDETVKVEMSTESKKFKTPQNSSKGNNNDAHSSSTQSNPWVALAAIKGTNALLNTNAKKNAKPPLELNTKNLNSAAAVASNMLKRPLNMASVASAAAALMNSPAALRAFSELRKRDLSKPKKAEPITPLKVILVFNA